MAADKDIDLSLLPEFVRNHDLPQIDDGKDPLSDRRETYGQWRRRVPFSYLSHNERKERIQELWDELRKRP